MENKMCQLHKGSKEWNMIINLYAGLLKITAAVLSVAGSWAKKHAPKVFEMPSGAGKCRCALGFKFDADKLFPEAFIEVAVQGDSLTPAYLLGSARNNGEPLAVFDSGAKSILAVFAGLFMSEVHEKVKAAGFKPKDYVGAVLRIKAKDALSVSLVPDQKSDGSTGVSLEMPHGVSTASIEQVDSVYHAKLPTGNATISSTGNSACTIEGAALAATLELFTDLLLEGVVALLDEPATQSGMDCVAGTMTGHLNS